MKHTGAFYFLLGNVQPKLRQRLASIQLLALVKSSTVKEVGINHILKFIVNDILQLESVCIGLPSIVIK